MLQIPSAFPARKLLARLKEADRGAAEVAKVVKNDAKNLLKKAWFSSGKIYEKK